MTRRQRASKWCHYLRCKRGLLKIFSGRRYCKQTLLKGRVPRVTDGGFRRTIMKILVGVCGFSVDRCFQYIVVTIGN